MIEVTLGDLDCDRLLASRSFFCPNRMFGDPFAVTNLGGVDGFDQDESCDECDEGSQVPFVVAA